MTIKAPFPYAGGKSRVAALVWERFGDVLSYIEPFAGSLAVLLGRPHFDFESGNWRDHKGRVETASDTDGMITNFWRAVQHDPDAVADAADRPVQELELHAIHKALHRALLSTEGMDADALDYAASKNVLPFAARLTTDQDFYDARLAGWWCWGQCSWIGDNFARPKCRALPHLGNAGRGVHRQLPHLGDAGNGVNRQLPHLGNTGGACAQKRAALLTWFRALRDRLCRVRVVCGDWERICGDSVLFGPGTPCGVFLDPPYSQDAGVDTVYGEHHDPGVSARVRAWCAAHGDDPKLRIALCGYEGEGHDALESLGWRVEHWKARGGYSNQSGSQNRHRERIWFSPHCLGAVQATLWGD